MAIDFPSYPSLNQTYTFGNYTWQWNGVAWDNISTTYGPTGPTGPAGAPGGFYYQTTPPASPTSGDRWVNSQNGVEYTYANDGNSFQWIQLTSKLEGPQGPTGPQGLTTMAGQFDGGFPNSVYGGTVTLDAGGIII
jgi:hypothetical protein